MLTIYRRHLKTCDHRSEGRKYRRCRCPIWVDGIIAGQEIRESLDLRNWEEAQQKLNKWETEGSNESEPEPEPMTIQQGCEEFLRDAEARQLREPTVYKYRLLFRHMVTFADDHGLRFLRELDVATLRKFRASWPNRNLSALKKLECLRAFFRFAWESKWIEDNPARKIARPEITDRPTLPFTREEMIRVLAACDLYGSRAGQANARRLRALVLLLRYTGMRIGDSVTLQRDRITGNKLLLYTAKTGTPVYCPLPDFVV